jgi:hypothetical protein
LARLVKDVEAHAPDTSTATLTAASTSEGEARATSALCTPRAGS